jgi:hypothetical protein
MTIYHRLIQPFFDGMKGSGKSKTNTDNEGMKFKTPASKKNVETVDPKKIQDAEFEEIK